MSLKKMNKYIVHVVCVCSSWLRRYLCCVRSPWVQDLLSYGHVTHQTCSTKCPLPLSNWNSLFFIHCDPLIVAVELWLVYHGSWGPPAPFLLNGLWLKVWQICCLQNFSRVQLPWDSMRPFSLSSFRLFRVLVLCFDSAWWFLFSRH